MLSTVAIAILSFGVWGVGFTQVTQFDYISYQPIPGMAIGNEHLPVDALFDELDALDRWDRHHDGSSSALRHRHPAQGLHGAGPGTTVCK